MPGLRNLLTEPAIEVLEDQAEEDGQRSACLQVEGLVCNLCAARVKRALCQVPNVDRVDFNPREDRFSIRYRPGRTGSPDLAEAAASAVVAPQVRRWIDRLWRRVTR